VEIWCGRRLELAKDWRSDRYLWRLEALLVVLDAGHSLVKSGSGDVIETDDGIVAIGSGGPCALSAARALQTYTSRGVHAMVGATSKNQCPSLCLYQR